MIIKKNIFLIILLFSFIFLALPGVIFAAGLLPDCIKDGNCNLNEMAEVFGNVARIILGITGSAALLMFIYGGFVWLTAAGAPDKVESGRKILVGAVIGIIIILGAYVGVNFFMDAIGASETKTTDTRCEDAHSGWSCQTKTEITGSTRAERVSQAAAIGCETGLCPGANNIVCCPRE